MVFHRTPTTDGIEASAVFVIHRPDQDAFDKQTSRQTFVPGDLVYRLDQVRMNPLHDPVRPDVIRIACGPAYPISSPRGLLSSPSGRPGRRSGVSHGRQSLRHRRSFQVDSVIR